MATHPERPFIAWTTHDDWNLPAAALRRSSAEHLRAAMGRLEPFVGAPAIEGVIVYDTLDSGLASADLLGRHNRRLSDHPDGESCAPLFDEAEFCASMNAQRTTAALHAGSRAMLISLAGDPSRRLLLMHQSEAVAFSPLGRRAQEGTGADRVGLLAHELAHAQDYATGRLGRPSLDECVRACGPERGAAMAAVADMALAEYVATRAECAAQVALFGACSSELTQRIAPMARATFAPVLGQVAGVQPSTGPQAQIDRHHLGYVLGTLAAYAEAQAPVADRLGVGMGWTTDKAVANAYPARSVLPAAVARAIPALHHAARAPSCDNREALAATLAGAIDGLEARSNARAARAAGAPSRGW